MGLIDANVPMNYRVESSTSSAKQFRAWLNGFAMWDGNRPTYVGIDIYNNDVSGVARQIEAVRKAKLAGFSIFSFNEVAKREALVNALAGSAMTRQAQLPDTQNAP